MTQQPVIIKTLRIPSDLHDLVLKRLGTESFNAYVVKLIAEDVKKTS
jgi:hypothetical protein